MSTIKKEAKPCSFKFACLFHRTSCSNFFFEKYCVKCTKALAAIPFFHGECVNLIISQQFDNFYRFFFHEFTIHRTAGEGGNYLFNSFYHFCPLCRHLNISRATTAESSPLHLAAGESLVAEYKSLTTKLHALAIAVIH